jgi:hypothetical protein
LALLNSFLALRVQTLLGENRGRSRRTQTAAISTGLVALLVFLAGWSSLSLAFELARPLRVSAPLVAQDRHLTASQKIGPRRGKPHGQLTEIKLPLPNPSAPRGIPSTSDEIAFLPADGGNLDALIASPQVESKGSLGQDHERSTWDEAPPSKPLQSPVSWRRIIMGAATDALGRIAQGRKGEDEDGRKDFRQP